MALRHILAFAAAAALALPAQAQTVTASDPSSVVQALEAAGLPARQTVDELGEPQIDSNVGDTNFSIFFFDCTNGRDCRSIQFHASYEHPVPAASVFDIWNRDVRYGRAFVSERGHPTMEMDVNLDAPGGISRALFRDSLDLFVVLVGMFEQRIGWE